MLGINEHLHSPSIILGSAVRKGDADLLGRGERDHFGTPCCDPSFLNEAVDPSHVLLIVVSLNDVLDGRSEDREENRNGAEPRTVARVVIASSWRNRSGYQPRTKSNIKQ